jgi:hypothetical protein
MNAGQTGHFHRDQSDSSQFLLVAQCLQVQGTVHTSDRTAWGTADTCLLDSLSRLTPQSILLSASCAPSSRNDPLQARIRRLPRTYCRTDDKLTCNCASPTDAAHALQGVMQSTRSMSERACSSLGHQPLFWRRIQRRQATSRTGASSKALPFALVSLRRHSKSRSAPTACQTLPPAGLPQKVIHM